MVLAWHKYDKNMAFSWYHNTLTGYMRHEIFNFFVEGGAVVVNNHMVGMSCPHTLGTAIKLQQYITNREYIQESCIRTKVIAR